MTQAWTQLTLKHNIVMLIELAHPAWLLLWQCMLKLPDRPTACIISCHVTSYKKGHEHEVGHSTELRLI